LTLFVIENATFYLEYTELGAVGKCRILRWHTYLLHKSAFVYIHPTGFYQCECGAFGGV